MTKISIIIPTYNEMKSIIPLIDYLKVICAQSSAEIIVVDGCSTDATASLVMQADTELVQSPRGRAIQMNTGARAATGEVLFFLHADTFPPESFIADVTEALQEGCAGGCYQLRFDHEHWFLRFNCWFTRFSFTPFRFGDQGLFIRKDLFQQIGGFNENLRVLEDQEIISRIKKAGRFNVCNQAVITSARKYLSNGIFRLQFIFVLLYLFYKLGVSQDALMRFYSRYILEPPVQSA